MYMRALHYWQIVSKTFIVVFHLRRESVERESNLKGGKWPRERKMIQFNIRLNTMNKRFSNIWTNGFLEITNPKNHHTHVLRHRRRGGRSRHLRRNPHP